MRRTHDFYETAPWQVDALTDHHPQLAGSIFCPCVGDGSLMRRLKQNRPDLGPFFTNDIDPARAADTTGDATSREYWRLRIGQGTIDWVVENPPFGVEIEILRHAFDFCAVGVVFMSRLSFLEPTKDRGLWLAEHPVSKSITLERYSFTGDGKSDSATTQWLIWSKRPVASPHLVSAYGYKHGIARRQACA